MAKAERALREALVLLREEATEGACNRAYYAMFDAAHAVLLATELETLSDPIKTHHGLILKLKDLVDRGYLEADLAKSIGEVQFLRQLADYSSSPPEPADTTLAVGKAETFLSAVRAILNTITSLP